MPDKTEKSNKKVVVYIPARNTGHLLKRTFEEIPEGIANRIILVDNVSSDNTVEVATSLGIEVIKHDVNRGYGGSQKTGYRNFLKKEGDLVVMLHSDYQYDPKCIPDLIAPIINNEADAVLGSRVLGGRALQGGMPWWKYLFNRFLTHLENLVIGADIVEYHTGFRAYSRKLLGTIPFEENSDNFLFDTEILIQVHHFGFRIKEIPIPTRYTEDASMMTFGQGVVYGLGVFKALFFYLLHRLRISKNPQYLPKPS
jgi:glycosyltransferase involved in cell wall biosynthesis